jgi:hypothetical protein
VHDSVGVTMFGVGCRVVTWFLRRLVLSSKCCCAAVQVENVRWSVGGDAGAPGRLGQ